MLLFSYFYPETSPTASPVSNDPPSALRPSDTFKEPSKEEVPVRDAPLDEIWDFFETGLERLYTLVANPSLEPMSYTYYAMLYSHACDIHFREYDRHMRPGISEHQLYDRLEVFFMKKGQDVMEELAHSDTSREFMEIYSRRWTTYEAFVQRANNLFRGFNNFYADKRIPGVQEINALDRLEPGTGVQQLAFRKWKETLFGNDVKHSYTTRHLDIVLQDIFKRDKMTTSMDGSPQVTDDELSLAEAVVQSMVSIHFKANRTGASASKTRRETMRPTTLETLLEEDDDEVDVEDDDVDVGNDKLRVGTVEIRFVLGRQHQNEKASVLENDEGGDDGDEHADRVAVKEEESS
ncbi:hypothetical protein B9479_008303, partial [Cryptococcus floricola]